MAHQRATVHIYGPTVIEASWEATLLLGGVARKRTMKVDRETLDQWLVDTLDSEEARVAAALREERDKLLAKVGDIQVRLRA